MNPDAYSIAVRCTRGSDEGHLTFPEVLAALAQGGIERYHADLVRHEKTYYLPDGTSATVPARPVEGPAAAELDTDEVRAALRAVQQGASTYAAFCAHLLAAGCVGYLVTRSGRRAVYYGRTGEVWVEHFPAAR